MATVAAAAAAGGHAGAHARTIVSPGTFALVVGTILAIMWMSQPRHEDAQGLRLLHLKDDPDVEASRAHDQLARLVRLDLRREKSQDPRQDQRGWMLDPLAAAALAGLRGGATSCLVTHVGEVLPGKTRGNHRHHLYNETLLLWGAKMRFRNENPEATAGYGEVVLGPGDVAVVAGPAMQAHAISNIDPQRRIAYLMACQDGVHDPKDPQTDYKVWPDLV